MRAVKTAVLELSKHWGGPDVATERDSARVAAADSARSGAVEVFAGSVIVHSLAHARERWLHLRAVQVTVVKLSEHRDPDVDTERDCADVAAADLALCKAADVFAGGVVVHSFAHAGKWRLYLRAEPVVLELSQQKGGVGYAFDAPGSTARLPTALEALPCALFLRALTELAVTDLAADRRTYGYGPGEH